MALLDIFRRDKKQRGLAYEANTLRTLSTGWRVSAKKYSDIYIWTVWRKIFQALRNVHFYSISQNGIVDDMCRYIERNITTIVYNWWADGYIVMASTKDGLRLLSDTEYRVADGEVHTLVDGAFVIYSDEYSISRTTALRVIQNELHTLDLYRSADEYLTRTLGAVGIISGKEMPMSRKDKEDFLEEIKQKVGITPDRFQFLISTGALNYTPLQLPVEALRLDEKVTTIHKTICDYFGIPFDLVNLSGASTYANQEQAVKTFYSDCISPLAEVLLTAIKTAIRMRRDLLILSDDVTFDIDNVAMVASERVTRLEEAEKLIDITTKAGENVDTTSAEKRIQQILDQ